MDSADLRKDVAALIAERDALRDLVERMLPYLAAPERDEAEFVSLRRALCTLYQRPTWGL